MDIKKDNNQPSVSNSTNTLSFIVLKTERLTSALYLVTSLLSDNEPLKWKLRDDALSIMLALKNVTAEHMADYGQDFVFYKNIDIDSLTHTIENLVTLIEVALSAGTVSAMNLSLLKQEYLALSDILNGSIRESMRQFMLSGYDRQALGTTSAATTYIPSGMSFTRPTVNQTNPVPKESQPSTKTAPKKMSHTNTNDSEEKNERHDKIKSFLKDKGWMSIKDIASVIPECSLKTVQRDLSLMVEQGQLRKKGDRRWSRYTLFNQ